jgi:flagellin
MGITIGNNIASLRSQRKLAQSTNDLERVFERLSSGQRINRAADDAAGLAIADALRAQQRIAGVAVRNANDGISVVAIADGALAEIGSTLTRLGELSEQSANGVFNTNQRSALQNEFAALSSEIERIAFTTKFNDVTLLSGSSGFTLQVGFDSASTSQIQVNNVQGTLASLGLAQVNTSISIYSIIDTSIAASQSAARNALDAVNRAIGSVAAVRGTLGAAESRLQVTITNLLVQKENFASAESRIRDADVAQDASELTRLGILQQAGSAVLAQANQQPSIALTLLG